MAWRWTQMSAECDLSATSPFDLLGTYRSSPLPNLMFLPPRKGRLMQKPGWARIVVLTALIVAAAAASFVALGMRPDGIASYYRDTLTPEGFVVWFSGLVVATLSPPIIAVLCWFGSRRTRHGWSFHLLLVPVTYAVVRGAIEIMLVAASEPDSDGPTGWATDPAEMLMLICPAIYFATLGFTRLRRRKAPANGS